MSEYNDASNDFNKTYQMIRSRNIRQLKIFNLPNITHLRMLFISTTFQEFLHSIVIVSFISSRSTQHIHTTHSTVSVLSLSKSIFSDSIQLWYWSLVLVFKFTFSNVASPSQLLTT